MGPGPPSSTDSRSLWAQDPPPAQTASHCGPWTSRPAQTAGHCGPWTPLQYGQQVTVGTGPPSSMDSRSLWALDPPPVGIAGHYGPWTPLQQGQKVTVDPGRPLQQGQQVTVGSGAPSSMHGNELGQ